MSGSNGIRCWGDNLVGQLGNDATGSRAVQLASVANVVFGTTMISAGGQHTCAVVYGAARCWGSNRFGQLGNGSPDNDGMMLPDSHKPVDVSGLSSGVQAIAAGDSHACAVVNGAARCWGSNNFGQLGDGSLQLHRAPAPVSQLSSGVQAITAGRAHSCAIVSGAAMCWGFNGYGQLGNAAMTGPQPEDSKVPVPVAGLASGVQAIAAGQNHTCALVNGGVLCWGSNASGQLGSGVTDPDPVGAPVQVVGLTSGVLAIAAGQNHTCAILTGGAARCWGSNHDGQLGNGSGELNAPAPADSNVPVQVTGLTSGVQTIATGYRHTCATTAAGVWCWGFDEDGQVGIEQSERGAGDPDGSAGGAGGKAARGIDRSAASVVVAAPHRISELVLGGCADGSDEQVFHHGMVGCAGAVAFADRGSLCAPGYQPATASQWTSNRGTEIPTHDYWTNDRLRSGGSGTSSCFVSPSVGHEAGADNQMHVCSADGTDAEGNSCSWTQCGLYASAPNQFFGGGNGNTTAGTVCIPVSAPPSACTNFQACPKWENGFTSSMTAAVTGVFGSSRTCTQDCAEDGKCRPVSCTGTASQPTAACQRAAASRLADLRSSIRARVAAEASFDSPQVLQQRSAEAQAAASVTTSYVTQSFNFTEQCGSASSPRQSGIDGPRCQLIWGEHLECKLSITAPGPLSAPNEACGCAL